MEDQPAVLPAEHPLPSHTEAKQVTVEQEPAPSKAAVFGHPIHPMLIPFPIALLMLVAVTDVVFAVTDSTFWSSVSYYLLWAGLVSAGLAAVFGLIDFIAVDRARSVFAGWAHLILNVVIVALSIGNLLLRMGDTIARIMPWGLTVSIIVAVLLAASGWFGGELVYRHKVGVIPDE